MVKSPKADGKIPEVPCLLPLEEPSLWAPAKVSNAAPDLTITGQTPAPLLPFDVEGGRGSNLCRGGHPCSTGMLT